MSENISPNSCDNTDQPAPSLQLVTDNAKLAFLPPTESQGKRERLKKMSSNVVATSNQPGANQSRDLFFPHLIAERNSSLPEHGVADTGDTNMDSLSGKTLLYHSPVSVPTDQARPKTPSVEPDPSQESSSGYDSQQAKLRVRANSAAGHSRARQTLPGGSGQAIVGHGNRYKNSPRATVPEGTILVLLAEGHPISDVAGNLLESLDLDSFVKAKLAVRDRLIDQQLDSLGIVDAITRKEILVELENIQVLEARSRVDDYLLEPPSDLIIFENSISVAESTRLSDILEENRGFYALATSTERINEREPLLKS
ncbi:MAG: putative adhesin [Cyanobacteria bacterium P01_F01_bin.86]